MERFITLVEGTSPATLQSVPPGFVDLAFIDGGHYGTQPLEDFRAAESLLSDDGFMVFHDANDRYDVLPAIAMARANGFESVELDTSCNLAVVTRSRVLQNLTDVALALAARGTVPARTE